jgi:hypothetical protein
MNTNVLPVPRALRRGGKAREEQASIESGRRSLIQPNPGVALAAELRAFLDCSISSG